MYVVKIKTQHVDRIYLNVDAISYFSYNSDNNISIIKMKTGELFDIEGDITGKLAKMISTSTSGSTLTLE